ncbi:hypothetical protein [Novosphingobium sp. JCM 18896]|uniref:hypothetical protein n=1 Tax=Novosphingobium sp. JCM 18896 TaxID=2989731 RepID=UPI002223345F|nr:hypothetical protein [Novosphingobium sp. JCM 18896]MCW1429911.1 hypothetical protein [Novosphingobium sp. JCM 18896]
MKGLALAAAAAAIVSSGLALAQPVDLPIPAATTSEFPPGVTLGKAGGVAVYAGPDGRTLYGMDMRTLLRDGADPSQHCREACAQVWEPLLAPAGAKPNLIFPMGFGERGRAPVQGEYVQNAKAPDWTVIAGPQGPQWVYKGWHLVFVRKGEAPGSAAHEGDERMVWNTLKHVPPAPKLTAPVNVSAAFVEGAYALVDKEGRLLFTGSCAAACAGWQPLAAGLASRGVGADWTVDRAADQPQWLYRGKPAYVAEGAVQADLPTGAVVLRP